MSFRSNNFVSINEGVGKAEEDAGLIAEGTLAWVAGDNLTTELKTSAIDVDDILLGHNNIFKLVIFKPAENTAGNLTIKTYNVIADTDDTERDVFNSSHTVEMISSARTDTSFKVEGLFFGTNTIKLSGAFATDSGAITVGYKLYRQA